MNGPSDDEIIRAARDAAAHAYCPYSGFRVGAAILAADGRVFTGCNVENASFGLSICAERAALFAARSAGARSLVRLAVSCVDAEGATPGSRMPCGACRQVMAELLEPGAEVLVDGAGAFTLDELLPARFRLPTSEPPDDPS